MNVDLDGYFERIGYTGPHTASIDTLHAITRAHAQSIPFENIDVLLGRRIELAPAALYEKLVVAQRGGYCFEQNGLLFEVLTQLGFEVRPLSARVRVGVTDRDVNLPRTHLLLEVRIGDTGWITDVGVGAASLTRALRLEADTEQVTPHDRRRLQHVAGKWYHQILRDGVWQDVYEFTGETMPLIDRIVGNWYTSTHPDSKFRKNLAVALARPDGGRVTLHNNTLTRYGNEGPVEHMDVSAPEALRTALRAHFGIHVRADSRIRWPAMD